MSNDAPSHLVFLTVISGRKLKSSLTEALWKAGGHLINTVYGKSSAHADYLRDMFGLVPEENKSIITCLLPEKETDTVLDMLISQFHFDRPNTGIAFTISIGNISF